MTGAWKALSLVPELMADRKGWLCLPHFFSGPFVLNLFKIYLFILFIYFWLPWVFVAVCGLSVVAVSRATLCCSARASHCNGFSCCGARALGAWASIVVAHGLSSCGSRALERTLSSCGAQANLLRGMWGLPGPGLEPVFLALAGEFLTTVPPGKFLVLNLDSKSPILFQTQSRSHILNKEGQTCGHSLQCKD